MKMHKKCHRYHSDIIRTRHAAPQNNVRQIDKQLKKPYTHPATKE